VSERVKRPPQYATADKYDEEKADEVPRNSQLAFTLVLSTFINLCCIDASPGD